MMYSLLSITRLAFTVSAIIVFSSASPMSAPMEVKGGIQFSSDAGLRSEVARALSQRGLLAVPAPRADVRPTCNPVTLSTILENAEFNLNGLDDIVVLIRTYEPTDSLLTTRSKIDKAVVQILVTVAGDAVRDANERFQSLLSNESGPGSSPLDIADKLIGFLEGIEGVLASIIWELGPFLELDLDADLGPIFGSIADTLTNFLKSIFNSNKAILPIVQGMLKPGPADVIADWESLGFGFENVGHLLAGSPR